MLEHYGPILKPKVVIVNLFPNDVHINHHKVIMGKGIPERNYEEMFSYLERIRNYCEKFSIKLVLAVIPSKEQFLELKGYSVFQNRVEAWCHSRKLILLDPRTYFEQIGVDEIYFFWDPHFCVQGHRHYADFLHKYLFPIISDVLPINK